MNATIFYYRMKQEPWIDEFLTANEREYQIQIFIRVHWRLFAVLLARLYPIEIDFDDSKWWCPPRSGCFFLISLTLTTDYTMLKIAMLHIVLMA